MRSNSIFLTTFTLIATLCVENSIAIPVPMDSDVLEARSGSGSGSGTNKPTVKASDLKSSNYRKTALDSNPPGAYVPGPGESVVLDPKAKGDADHIAEAGAHIAKPLSAAGLSPSHPMTQEIGGVINSAGNLAMVDKQTDIAKGKLAAKPDSNPQHAAAAQSYMAQPEIQAKAKEMVAKIQDVTVKHGKPEVGQAIKESVAQVIPDVNKPSASKKQTRRRNLEETWEYVRSLEDLLDELD